MMGFLFRPVLATAAIVLPLAIVSLASSRANADFGRSGPSHGPKLIFVGTVDNNAVSRIEIFDGSTHAPAGVITDVDVPEGLAVDRGGALYESDGESQSVRIYPPPYRRASKILVDAHFIPRGVHVDVSGNVWLANVCAAIRHNCSGAGDVVEFARGSTTAVPLKGGPYSPQFVTTDAHGNVWADGLDASGNCIVGYWRGGAGSFVPAGIACNDVGNPNGNVPGGIVFDRNGNLLLAFGPHNEGIIGVFPPGRTKPAHAIVVYGDVLGFAFGPNEARLFVIDYNGPYVHVVTYPKGDFVNRLDSIGKALSVAETPAEFP